jgi:hypothetical protein
LGVFEGVRLPLDPGAAGMHIFKGNDPGNWSDCQQRTLPRT